MFCFGCDIIYNMSNLLDYLGKKNLEPISREAPLNTLDALTLARFSYLPFNQIDLQDFETISSIANKMQKLGVKKFLYPEDKEMIAKLGQNQRFANLETSDYVFRFNKRTVEQFAAITIHLSKNTIFVSFIGTDDTLSGWREDCNMAIQETVPSQKSAKKYLKTVATKYPDKKIYIGGHSKGGTLAMYATLTSKHQLARRIKFVYSFDGPGLSEKLTRKSLRKFKAAGDRSPLSRMLNYIPQDSVVGRLFSHAEKFQVIKSNAKNFYQHNVHTWQVNLREQKLVPAAITKKSDFVDQTISEWIKTMPKKQKKLFIDSIFKVLDKSKYNSPIGISVDGIRAIPDLFGSFRRLEKEDKKAVFFGLKKLISTAVFTREKKRK